MNTVRRIAKNTTVMLASQIVTYIFGFLYIIYAARYLGVEGYGILSFGLSFASIASIFLDLGLSTLLVREIARDKSILNKYLENSTVIKIFLAIMVLLISVIIVYFLNYSKEVIEVVFFASLFYIFSSFSGLFYSVFQAHEKMEYPSIGYALNSILLLAGTLYAISHNFDVLGFAFIFFIASLITFVYSILVCGWKFVFPKIHVNKTFCKFLIKEALPLSFTIIFAMIAFRIDTVILSLIKGNDAVGLYNAAYRLMEVLIFIPSVFTTSIFPVFSKYHVSSKESLKMSFKMSFKYLNLLGFPIAVGVTLLADKIILLIYGSAFAPSILILKILIWTLPIIFLTYTFGILMVSINKQDLYMKIVLVTMVFNIVMNILFIPGFSYIGASVITIFTELISFIMFYYYLSKFICKVSIHGAIIKPAIASLIMGLFIAIFDVNLFIIIPLAIIVYIVSLLILKTFSDEDMNIFRQITSIGK